MAHAYKASRLLGLLALLTGLMALSATVAQAEPGAYWEVGGTQIKNGTLLPEINAKKDSAQMKLLTKSGLSTVKFDCTDIRFSSGLLHELGRFTGKIHFSGCETWINGVLRAECTPHSPGAAQGLIETEPLEGLLKLHKPAAGGTEDVLEVLPVNAGMIFVTLELGSGKCPISGANVTGTLFLKDCKNLLLANELEHLLEEHPLTKLLFGSNALTIDGSFWTFLEGAHKGQLWSGHTA